MIIAVTAQGTDLKGEVDPRFGRAIRFLLVDSETMDLQVAENQQSLNVPQGAGIQAAQNVANYEPEVVLTGNCGPKALKTLQAAGIKVVVGVSGTIEDAIQAYLRGEFEHAKEANVEGHWV
jgi:predicted Fe-Mo cluster-binding NifX family protein